MCLVYGLWTPFGAPCPFSALEPLHFKLRGFGVCRATGTAGFMVEALVVMRLGGVQQNRSSSFTPRYYNL